MSAREYEIRELDGPETNDLLAFRNSIFGNISPEHWQAMGCTAAVAKKQGEIIGAIPLQYRQFMINGRASIPVAFENAVGVSQKARSLGIGTAMIDAAADFMSDRVDALYVYRGGERTDAYRFYRKTHHGDLFFQDTLTLAKPRGSDNDVQVRHWEESIALEKQLLAVFRTCYSGYGGYWRRENGYFAKVVASHVYKNDDCRLLIAKNKGTIVGYAVTNPHSPIWGGYCIYDIAAKAPAPLQKLLHKVEFLARRARLPVTIPSNRENPLYAALLKRGFEITEHTPYVMARILRPNHIFARLAGTSPVLKKLRLEAVTPHRDLVLNTPVKPAFQAMLYLKESQLSRLLSCRIDFQNAIQTNLIRMTPLPARIEKALHRAFRFSPWVSFGIDFV